jgi:hypothetical protein
MSYTINNADGSVLTTIAPNTVDTTTSLMLPGYAYPKWAQIYNQNFLYLLQNFASPVAPINPIAGQLWFNNSTGNLQIYISPATGWQFIATSTWLANEGYITQDQLGQYATIDWVEQQGYITESALGSFNFVTQSYVASQNYITSSYLVSKQYINQAALASAISVVENSLASSYVTETYFVGQDFVTQSYIAGQNFVTESYIAGQNFVQATSLSAYLTANQEITVSGDATGSGTSNINLTLSPTGVIPGTYTKVDVDDKGRVIAGSQITASDITTALGFVPTSIANFGASLGSNGYQILPSGLVIQWITGSTDPADNTTPIQTLPWALAFPNGLIGASVSTYIQNSASDDLWYQVVSSGSNSSQVIVQRQAGQGASATFDATTTPFIIGLGY